MKTEEVDKFLIVIGRLYGSGGRSIGHELAKRLGVKCYDRTLLSEAAASMGFDHEVFAVKDEKRPSLFRSALSFAYGAFTSADQSSMSDEKIYQYQSEVIRAICNRESCVIVGRTADYVMRRHPRMLSMFIHAPLSDRVKEIIKRREAGNRQEAEELAARRDRQREAYYNYYSNSSGWGQASNYHLCMDSTRVNMEALTALVKDTLKIKE